MRDGHPALEVVITVCMGVFAGFATLMAVLVYLFLTRPLHGAGPFPDAIYLLPWVVGVSVSMLWIVVRKRFFPPAPPPTRRDAS